MKESLISPDAESANIIKPSRKQRWLRRLKRLGWLAVWLATAIALFYAIENWRGRRAWNAYVAKVNASGDSVEPAAVIPPPVPDAENFALAPMFQEIFDAWYPSETAHEGGKAQLPPPRASAALQDLQRITDRPRKRPPAGTAWWHGGFVDLAAWQTFLQINPDPLQTPAENVLLALADFDPYAQQLHDRKDRPYSRFPIRYEHAPTISAPYYAPVQQLTRLASLRSTARLANGEREGAFEDLLLALRLPEAAGSDPIVMGALVYQQGLGWPLQPLWEGLARREWTDRQLAVIEGRLATVNLVRNFHSGLRAERNLCLLPALDLFRENPEKLWEDEGWKGMLSPSTAQLLGVSSYDNPGLVSGVAGALLRMILEQLLGVSSHDDPRLVIEVGEVALRLAPGGWYDQNKVAAGEWQDRTMACLDPASKRVHVDRVLALDQDFDRAKQARRSPYNFLEFPLYSRALISLANMQGNVGLARIAIALERHRIRRGKFPETLEELEPEFVPTGGFPQDPASGTAPNYKRLSTDQFTLYFNGWNGKDDGGILGMKKNGARALWREPTIGDTVWPVRRDSHDGTR